MQVPSRHDPYSPFLSRGQGGSLLSDMSKAPGLGKWGGAAGSQRASFPWPVALETVHPATRGAKCFPFNVRPPLCEGGSQYTCAYYPAMLWDIPKGWSKNGGQRMRGDVWGPLLLPAGMPSSSPAAWAALQGLPPPPRAPPTQPAACTLRRGPRRRPPASGAAPLLTARLHRVCMWPARRFVGRIISPQRGIL